MTTTLNLDAPGATAALCRCYTLLRRWACEARIKKAADGNNPGLEAPSAASSPPVEAEPNREEVTSPMDTIKLTR